MKLKKAGKMRDGGSREWSLNVEEKTEKRRKRMVKKGSHVYRLR